MKTSELIGTQLDWAVAKCEGWSAEGLTDIANGNVFPEHAFSSNWAQGGPIIERESISVLDANGCWAARYSYYDNSQVSRDYFGPTPLIAAMRCYVASKLGDEVDVPEELL